MLNYAGHAQIPRALSKHTSLLSRRRRQATLLEMVISHAEKKDVRKYCEKHPQLEPLNSFLMGLSRNKRARAVRLRPETKSFHFWSSLGN
jgi:hypothetical protein